MIKAPPTPKGFRDINPALAKKRRLVIGKIIEVLEEAGYVPLETPTVEFAETLLNKYGEEERLIYQFTDRGGRKLALRYDLTVPLARYVASNPNLIARGPFRRYQVGQVFRGENPQKGRWREFTQLDFDTVGSSDLKEDAKIVATTLRAAKALGVNNPVLYLNDRKNFQGLPKKAVVAIDKLEKIGTDAVVKEMAENGLVKDEASKIVENLKNQKPTQDTETILKLAQEMGCQKEELKYVSTLARGLDYYTGAIFELRAPAYGNLSIGAGGRYDNLIGSFVYPAKGGAKKQIPAVGFSFGLDRLIEAMDQLNLFPQ